MKCRHCPAQLIRVDFILPLILCPVLPFLLLAQDYNDWKRNYYKKHGKPVNHP